jgi:hypothetical protein
VHDQFRWFMLVCRLTFCLALCQALCLALNARSIMMRYVLISRMLSHFPFKNIWIWAIDSQK